MQMPTVQAKYRGTREYHLVFCRLITAARYRGTCRYQQLAPILGLPLQGNYLGREIGKILGEISEDEALVGRPVLSAVAVNSNGQPGEGFFSLARMLGKLTTTDESGDQDFWQAEKEAIYQVWGEDLSSYVPPAR